MIQLIDIAHGLDYLHSQEVIHGNLKQVSNKPSLVHAFPCGSHDVHDVYKGKHPCGFHRSCSPLRHRVCQACTHRRIMLRLGQGRGQRLPMGGTGDLSRRQIVQTVRCIFLRVYRHRGTSSKPLVYNTVTNSTKISTGNFIWEGVNATEVRSRILDGDRPRRLEGERKSTSATGLWRMFPRCWEKEPDSRISVSQVLDLLRYL